jgi:hypothetical protein
MSARKERGVERMKTMCIYESNRGLGDCAGRIEKVRVTSKRSPVWKGLEGLKARLKESGEEPGVCGVHEKRAEENGYIRGEAPQPPRGKP